jgi:hypothetical protein
VCYPRKARHYYAQGHTAGSKNQGGESLKCTHWLTIQVESGFKVLRTVGVASTLYECNRFLFPILFLSYYKLIMIFI